MGDKTEISWSDSTWSPLRVRVRQDAAEIAKTKGYTSLIQIATKTAGKVGQHCENVSPECDHCYAEAFNHRCLPSDGTGLPYDRRSRDLVEAFVDENVLLQPLKWKRPRKIFVENRSDLFGDWYTDEMIDRVFAVAALCPEHSFQVLTKRPERMLVYLSNMSDKSTAIRIADRAKETYTKVIPYALPSEKVFDGRRVALGMPWVINAWPLANVWPGVTAGTKKSWSDRVDVLRRTPAAVRYVSAEPLLEDLGTVDLTGIHQVITGGESGRGARPMHPDWARSLRDQCVAAGVAYFMKQMGGSRDKRHNLEDIPLDLQIREYPHGV